MQVCQACFGVQPGIKSIKTRFGQLDLVPIPLQRNARRVMVHVNDFRISSLILPEQHLAGLALVRRGRRPSKKHAPHRLLQAAGFCQLVKPKFSVSNTPRPDSGMVPLLVASATLLLPVLPGKPYRKQPEESMVKKTPRGTDTLKGALQATVEAKRQNTCGLRYAHRGRF